MRPPFYFFDNMMMQEDLTEFVQKKLKRGYPSGEIKIDLLKEGYTETDIDKAVASQVFESKPNLFRISGWIISGILFIFIGIQQITSDNKFGYVLLIFGIISLLLKSTLGSEKQNSF